MSNSTADFQLGQPVSYRHTIRRRPKFWGRDTVQFDKFWTTEVYPGKHTEGGQGIVVGKRTLSNGNTSYAYDDGTTYTPKEHFTAYLVAYGLRRKPVFVLPEHLQELS